MRRDGLFAMAEIQQQHKMLPKISDSLRPFLAAFAKAKHYIKASPSVGPVGTTQAEGLVNHHVILLFLEVQQMEEQSLMIHLEPSQARKWCHGAPSERELWWNTASGDGLQELWMTRSVMGNLLGFHHKRNHMTDGLKCQELLHKMTLAVCSSFMAKPWTPFTYQSLGAQTVDFSLNLRERQAGSHMEMPFNPSADTLCQQGPWLSFHAPRI
ncbi:hypothetical protein AV530_008217 [Patagioenas fasciata monilis]|uniref:Uncharacterized protein n=1 Tax=Patagioenas fasciata monilis TaxID=372326 RepID=A0A1V4KUV3_PATFA|nr:hypothetical protein AV530_008217 [Patagioenas fasciata monilis]